MTDEELKALVVGLALSQKETSLQIEFLRESQKETDRQLRETDRQLRETDQKIQSLRESLRESQKETNEQIRRVDEQITRVDEQITRVNQQVGDIGSRLGEFVVEMIKPNALDLFNQRGIAVEEVHTGIEIHRPNYQSDIDLMLVNGCELVAIEVKSAFKMGHIYKHLERLKHIKQALPAYANYTVYGGIGSMVMSNEIRDRGVDEGLFVIVPKGESLTLINDENFWPKAW